MFLSYLHFSFFDAFFFYLDLSFLPILFSFFVKYLMWETGQDPEAKAYNIVEPPMTGSPWKF